MNKKVKICVVCIGLMVVGGCLAAIGLRLGATGNVDMNPVVFKLGDGEGHFSIGLATPAGKTELSGDRVTDSEEISQPIQVIKTKIGLGDVKVIDSDEFKVIYTYDKGIGKPDINISEGTLTIEDQFSKFSKQNIGFSRDMKNSEAIEYKIYCPKGTTLQLIQINNSLGDIEISGAKTESLDLKIGVGDIKLADMEVGEAKIDVSLGDIKAENIGAEGLAWNSSAGDIEAEGALKGKSSFTTDMGDIKIKTTLKKEAYSLDLNTKLGDTTVNGDKKAKSYQVDNAAENHLNVQSSAGEISVDFD